MMLLLILMVPLFRATANPMIHMVLRRQDMVFQTVVMDFLPLDMELHHLFVLVTEASATEPLEITRTRKMKRRRVVTVLATQPTIMVPHQYRMTLPPTIPHVHTEEPLDLIKIRKKIHVPCTTGYKRI